MGRVLDGAVLQQRVNCGRLLGGCTFERGEQAKHPSAWTNSAGPFG
jgi:hypothetical protein